MSAPVSAPETYQQWLTCFQYLQEHPSDFTVCSLLDQASCVTNVSESFKSRLSDTVSIMLSYHCRRFLKQLDLALAEGEADMAALLALRFRRSIRECMFYRRLSFLEDGFVAVLDDGYTKQVYGFWENVLKQLRQTVRERDDPALEDLFQEIRKIRII